MLARVIGAPAAGILSPLREPVGRSLGAVDNPLFSLTLGGL